jgi:hypothetical protein
VPPVTPPDPPPPAPQALIVIVFVPDTITKEPGDVKVWIL